MGRCWVENGEYYCEIDVGMPDLQHFNVRNIENIETETRGFKLNKSMNNGALKSMVVC